MDAPPPISQRLIGGTLVLIGCAFVLVAAFCLFLAGYMVLEGEPLLSGHIAAVTPLIYAMVAALCGIPLVRKGQQICGAVS
jgi:hypothetical protein